MRQASAGDGWRCPAGASRALRRRERAFQGWEDHSTPGWLKIDPVAHCGGRIEGRLLWNRMVTNIATGWRERLPIVMRDAAVVIPALQRIDRQLCSPLRGIDADDDDDPGLMDDQRFFPHLPENAWENPPAKGSLPQPRAARNHPAHQPATQALLCSAVQPPRLAPMPAPAAILGQGWG